MLLPDGRKQIVEYTADLDGYKPTVRLNLTYLTLLRFFEIKMLYLPLGNLEKRRFSANPLEKNMKPFSGEIDVFLSAVHCGRSNLKTTSKYI